MNIKDKKVIVADGCSWTAGDIVDPILFPGQPWHVNHPDNAQYRYPRVWPDKLGKLLNLETINQSIAGSSNDGILRRILSNIPNILSKYEPQEVVVIIGWTSPERKDFFYSDNKKRMWKTFYPKELFDNDESYRFHKEYILNYWNEEEYMSRYLITLISVHSYLKLLNIDHYFFDAFYESNETIKSKSKHTIFDSINLYDFIKDKSKDLEHNLEGRGIIEQYLKIYDTNYIKQSMIGIIKTLDLPRKLIFDDTYHPTEYSHNMWAEYIAKTLKKSV